MASCRSMLPLISVVPKVALPDGRTCCRSGGLARTTWQLVGSTSFTLSLFGAGLAIRPLQRADALGLFRQLLAMDVEDAEGLDGGEVGEDKTRGNGQ